MFKKLFVPPAADDEEEEAPPSSGPSQRHLMHDHDRPRAVTFYNFEPGKLLHYACQILDCNPIQVANDNRAGYLDWSLQCATGQPDMDHLLGTPPADPSGSQGTFPEIVSRSRTFCVQGIELRNENFKQRGIEEVQAFYGRGGTVVMVGGNCDELNKLFGCKWSYTGRGNYDTQDFECVPTKVATRIFGLDLNGYPQYPSQIFVKEAMLIEVPPGEALYIPRPFQSKRQFMEYAVTLEEEWYDAETGEISEDNFYEKNPNHHEEWSKIVKREQEWGEYVPCTATPVAVHKSEKEGGGTLIWIGDACDKDTSMRSLLRRFLTTDFHAASAALARKPDDKPLLRYDAPKGKYKIAV